MTKVTLTYQNSFISNIKVIGHANKSTYGSDIVCSSISTAMILICNIIEKLDTSAIVSANESKALISLEIKNHTEEINVILNEFKVYLMSLCAQYPKNVSLLIK